SRLSVSFLFFIYRRSPCPPFFPYTTLFRSFTTLLVLIFERLFKLGEHWQLDHRLEAFFRRVKHFSLGRTLGMTIIAMGVTFLLRSEEHTSELQSRFDLVCRLLLDKKKIISN